MRDESGETVKEYHLQGTSKVGVVKTGTALERDLTAN